MIIYRRLTGTCQRDNHPPDCQYGLLGSCDKSRILSLFILSLISRPLFNSSRSVGISNQAKCVKHPVNIQVDAMWRYELTPSLFILGRKRSKLSIAFIMFFNWSHADLRAESRGISRYWFGSFTCTEIASSYI